MTHKITQMVVAPNGALILLTDTGYVLKRSDSYSLVVIYTPGDVGYAVNNFLERVNELR